MSKSRAPSRESIVLHAEKRAELKKRATGHLRAMKRIPAVMYGVQAPLPISIDSTEFHHAFRHISENTVIDIKIGSSVRHAIIKDYAMEPLRGEIIHLDFLEIKKGKLLKTHVPLVATGSAVGVRSGGIFEQPLHEIEVECLPKDLPEKIEVDVSALDIGQSLRVSDLSLPVGTHVLTHAEVVLFHIATVRAVQVAAASEEEASEESADQAAAEE